MTGNWFGASLGNWFGRRPPSLPLEPFVEEQLSVFTGSLESWVFTSAMPLVCRDIFGTARVFVPAQYLSVVTRTPGETCCIDSVCATVFSDTDIQKAAVFSAIAVAAISSGTPIATVKTVDSSVLTKH